MLKARSELYFSIESLGADCFGDVSMKDFEGDVSIVAKVAREKNRRESALSELALDCVSVG
jgi:hypothetical protein